MKFMQYIYRLPRLVSLEKLCLSCMVLDKGILYKKIISDAIYKFTSFEFCHLRLLK
jgi:hypothetical protein